MPKLTREEEEQARMKAEYEKQTPEQKPIDEAAEKEARRLAARSPEEVEFDQTIKHLSERIAGMQLRPEETKKFADALETLTRTNGHPK